MIDYFATKNTRKIIPDLQAYMLQNIYPYELDWVKSRWETIEPLIRDMKRDMQKLGVWNLYLDTNHGGPGLTLMEVAQISEILGRSPYGHIMCNAQAPDAGNIELLLKYASDVLKEKYLIPLLNGDSRSCFGMTEPQRAGSNPIIMDTTAKIENDRILINGRKWFTTGADGADFCIIMAISDPQNENPYQRASMVLVPTDTKGFIVERNIPVMGHQGSGLHSHAEITLNNVEVPRSHLLGKEGEGFKIAQERLGPGRIHHCMRWIGISSRCFDMMCKRAVSRKLSENEALGDKQMVQKMIAESKAEIDAARLSVLHAAYVMDKYGQKSARKEISAIKFFTSEILGKVIDRSIQVHGALGITDDTILSWFYREERGSRIYDGTDETHKASLAKQILKAFRD